MQPAAETAPQSLMTRDEAASALLTFLYSGGVGSPQGKQVSYSLLNATDSTFSFYATMYDPYIWDPDWTRCRVDIDRVSREVQPPTPMTLSAEELEEALRAATGHAFAEYSRSPSGATSKSYAIPSDNGPHYRGVETLCSGPDLTGFW